MFHVQVRNSTNMIQIQLATPSNAPWCWNIYQHLSSWWPKKAGGDHLAAMLARIHVVRVASMYLMDIGSTCFPAVILLEWSMNMYTIYHNIWLVVWAPLKNMKVSWDDYSQYMENKKCFKPPTRYRMCIHFCQKSISHMNSLLFFKATTFLGRHSEARAWSPVHVGRYQGDKRMLSQLWLKFTWNSVATNPGWWFFATPLKNE